MSKRPSPDTVLTIDLTLSDDEQEARLGDVRKELEPPSVKRSKRPPAGLKTTGLDEEHDESDGDEVIVLEDVPDWAIPTTKVKKEGTKSGRKQARASRNSSVALNGTDDDVQIVVPAAATFVAAPVGAVGTDPDDDVVVEGVANEQRLPHSRHDCTVHAFVRYGNGRTVREVCDANKQFCDLCYCFACDCPAGDCKEWCPPHGGTNLFSHCCAEDTFRWTRVRAERKVAKQRQARESSSTATAPTSRLAPTGAILPPLGYHYTTNGCHTECCSSCWCFVCDIPGSECDQRSRHRHAVTSSERWIREREQRKLCTFGEQGPFAPDTADAPKDDGLTKCRACGWFSRLLPRSEKRSTSSSEDWCNQCGRVASEEDFGKGQQGLLSKKSQVDSKMKLFCLGTKYIRFRIKAHDPRRFEAYKRNWEEADTSSPEWNYDEANREEEVFLHRIGKHPKMINILVRIPVVPEDKVAVFPGGSLTADMTDWVLVDGVNHIQLLDVLKFLPERTCRVSASWDKVARLGRFKIQLYLDSGCFAGSTHRTELSPEVLGHWFENIFPFPLEELCGSLAAEKEPRNYSVNNGPEGIKLDFIPFTVDRDLVLPAAKKEFISAVDSFREKRTDVLGSLTLLPSVSRYEGSASDADVSLRGSLMRFCREKFRSMICNLLGWRSSFSVDDIVRSHLGQISDHARPLDSMLRNSLGRAFDPARHGLHHRHGLSHGSSQIHHLVGFKQQLIAQSCLYERCNPTQNERKENFIGNMMVRLENLGHKGVEHVNGLNIELLDFQKQTLKWALEREQVPGGIQSFLWPKLPPGEGRKDLYYNPILNQFRKDKPELVRGGFICQQMGLGKTVISLALILRNPAPELPASGSPISSLSNVASYGTMSSVATGTESEEYGWDKELYNKTSVGNKKRGSVLSRGTLVICPVSLVGQWIEEARAKLQEPGLIYPYHGQNRTRDAMSLASNSIVVTTYHVLASDANHHKKFNGEDYCPPCEQVRWWRIIADEGHCLRYPSTQFSKAARSLVADHKWVVTGTPFSTSVKDIYNPLQFLGIEYCEQMFKKIVSTSRGFTSLDEDLLMCLLRPILIRHSQAQKYRNTETTLMSLPPKKESTITVKFSDAEKIEFDKIEKEAKDFYLSFRARHQHDMSKHFLKVSQKLMPLRVASSGGKYPLYTESTVTGPEDDDEGEEINDDTGTDVSREPKKKKKERTKVVYSDFAFQSKFNVLIEILEKIRDTEPEAKSLIFSQFASTLNWLKEELPKHGFQFRTLSGDMSMMCRAKALHDFQQDPPTTIFLLSMRAGAVGINLTQANRVFLMEPSFNPALEAQAIGRVHRLGQKHSVEIFRLICERFETRMVQVLVNKFGPNVAPAEEDDNSNVDSSGHDSVDGTNAEEKANARDQVAPADVRVGNVSSDKAEILTEEFDVLFGVKNLVDEEAAIKSETESDDGTMIDWSSV